MSRSKELLNYSLTRLGLMPFMLWIIASMVFILLRVAPGDPIDAVLGTRADELARATLRAKLGLDLPLWKQYIEFINNIIQGNFGEALVNQEPVEQIIKEALPASIELGFTAFVIALILGGLIGFCGIKKPGSKNDLSGRLYGISTYAIPPFWAAMVIQLVFAVKLGWLPVGGRFPPGIHPPSGSGFYLLDSITSGNLIALKGAIRHLILPATTLGILISGVLSRSIRLNMDRALKTDHVEAAKSRGLTENRIIFRHALPNALLPVLTITGLTIASLVGGALLIEVTFSWPGIAMRLQEAINQRDYPVVQGIVVVISSLVVMISIIIDLLIAFIDPRISY